jgi:exopolysaccharide production protein ExoZ
MDSRGAIRYRAATYRYAAARMNVHRPSSYVYGLDIVRFLCTLMVCAFHLTWHNADMVTTMPFGWIGVQIFFVISGVVIANSAAQATPLHFLRSRFLRLYPAAWLVAIVNFGLLLAVPLASFGAMGVWVDPSLKALSFSLALAGNTFLTSAYWTLPIELAFYALILLAVQGGGAKRFVLVARLLVVASIPYLILLFAATAGSATLGWFDFGYGPKNMLLLRHGVFFAIGMYFWLLNSQHRLALADRLLLALALGAAGLEIHARASQIVASYAVGAHGPFGIGFLVSGALAIFAACVCAIFLSLRHAQAWVPPARLATWLRTLGLVTYPFYLLHEILGASVLHAALARGFGHAAGLGAAMAAIGAVAYLIARHGEPALRRAIGHALGRDGKA